MEVYAGDLLVWGYFRTKTQGIVRTPKVNETDEHLINTPLPISIGFVGADVVDATTYKFEYKGNPSLKGVKPLESIAR